MLTISTVVVSPRRATSGNKQSKGLASTAASAGVRAPVSQKACAGVKCARCFKMQAVAQAVEAQSGMSRRAAMSTATVGAALALMPVSVQPVSAEEECEYLTAASGLQYCDVRTGDGDAPFKGESIRAHYTGKLASNGKKFDSSYDRGSPLPFKVGVGMVIKGWDEGILGGEGIPPMKAGGIRKLRVPSALGYGTRGAGGAIPPNADLLFEVELVDVGVQIRPLNKQ
mmetsp:Transcript_19702/g.33123  ORF Transcript_19702/g.33123 Transcript_19702/m.33123 type:complete len:227 (-) Transcript_19702:215-895(-)